MTPDNRRTRLTRQFFNVETREFTFSCLRDLFKSLLIFTCAAIFHFAAQVLAAIGFAEWAIKLLIFIDYCWVIVTVALTAYIFVGKLGTRIGH